MLKYLRNDSMNYNFFSFKNSVNKRILSTCSVVLLLLLALASCMPFNSDKSALKFSTQEITPTVDPSTSVSFPEVKKILNNNCYSCHQGWKNLDEASFVSLRSSNTALNPFIVKGNADQSWFIKKLMYHPVKLNSSQGAKMPLSTPGKNASNFSEDDYNFLKNWINNLNKKAGTTFTVFWNKNSVSTQETVDIGSSVLGSNGALLNFEIQNNLSKEISVVAKFSNSGSDNAFEFKNKFPLAIKPYQSKNLTILFKPSSMGDYNVSVIFNNSAQTKEKFTFTLVGKGSDLLKQHKISCDPLQKKATFDYIKPHRKQVWQNNLLVLFPSFAPQLLKEQSLINAFDTYPNISLKDYARVPQGGMSPDLVEAANKIAWKVGDLIAGNKAYYQALFSLTGASCSNISDLNNLSMNCLKAVIDRLALLTFARKVEAGKLDPLYQVANAALNLGDVEAALSGAIAALMLQPEHFFAMDLGSAEINPGSNSGVSGSRFYKSTPGLLRSLGETLNDAYPEENAVNYSLTHDLAVKSNYDELVALLKTQKNKSGVNLYKLKSYNLLKEYLDLEKNSGFGQAPEMQQGLLADYKKRGINVDQTYFGDHAKDGIYADLTLLYYNVIDTNATAEELLSTPMVVAVNPMQKFVTGASKIDLAPQLLSSSSTSTNTRGIALSNRYMYGGTRFYRNPFGTANKWLQLFLCEDIGTPDPTKFPPIAFEPPPLDPARTVRDVYEERTALPACQSCHEKMNPVGFALDSINAVGEATEDELFFNAQGELLATHNKDTRGELNVAGQFIQAMNAFDLRDQMKGLKTFELCLAKRATTSVFVTDQLLDKGCAIKNSFQALAQDRRPLAEIIFPLINYESGFRELHFDSN